MIRLAIISGKGGTGKTMVTAALAHLLTGTLVLFVPALAGGSIEQLAGGSKGFRTASDAVAGIGDESRPFAHKSSAFIWKMLLCGS